jgi:hypothetical protein
LALEKKSVTIILGTQLVFLTQGNFMKKNTPLIIAAILLLVAFALWYQRSIRTSQSGEGAIYSYEECVAAGNPVLESYPPQCTTKDGQTFTQDVGNAAELQDQIVVENPGPGDMVQTPFTINGSARGQWFFEASFPAKVLDESGNIVGQTPVQAEGEWMTEEFVPFSTSIPFSVTDSETGTLVLQKDNPSGLPENDAELRIPIRFK